MATAHRIGKFVVRAWLVLATCGAWADEGVVRNGGFGEKDAAGKPASWAVATWAAPGESGLDADANSAPAALRIRHTEPTQYTLVGQNLTLKPNTRYRISFWMKAEKVARQGEKPSGARLILLDRAGKTALDGSINGIWKPAEGTFGWSRAELPFQSGADTLYKLYLTLHHATGSVWYDDVAVEEILPENLSGKIAAEVFPVDYQKGLYRVNEGFPGALIYKFRGDARAIREASLVLDLPEGFECLGASPWLPTRILENVRVFDPEKCSRESVDREGARYTRYTLGIAPFLLRGMKPDEVSWGYQERVYVKALPGTAGKSGKAYWQVVAGGYRTAEQSFELRALPPLAPPARKLNRFDLLVCYLWHQTAPFPEVREAYSRYWRSLQERPYTFPMFGWNNLDEKTRETVCRDFRTMMMIGSSGGHAEWCRRARQAFPQEQIPPVVRLDGKEQAGSMCPGFIADDTEGRVWWEGGVLPEIRERLRLVPKTEALVFDFEPGAMEYCFCERCRTAFAAFAGLKATPSAAEIRAKHSPEWFQFRVAQHARLVETYNRCMRKHFPDVPFWICTDPLHATGGTLSEWCGCDERLFDGHVAGHMPMPYYSGLQFFKDVALNVKTLKKPVFPLIDPAEQLEDFFKRYTPAQVKQNIVAAAAVGCVGFGFWPGDNLDGEYLARIAEGISLVAEGEAYYLNHRDDALAVVTPVKLFERTFQDEGKPVSVSFPAFGEKLQVTAHERAGGCLITVLNYDESADAVLKVAVPRLPKGAYQVRDVGSGKLYLDAQGKPLSANAIRTGFLSRVARGDVLLLEIAKGQAPAGGAGIRQSEFAAEVAALRRRFGEGSRFAGVTRGEASVAWGDADGSGVPAVKLALGKGRAYLALDRGASVVAWKRAGEERSDVLFHQDRGFLGDMVLYSDSIGRGEYDYELQGMDVRGGAPEVTFAHQVASDGANPQGTPQEGLRVEKRVALEENGSALRFAFTFTNHHPAKREMPLGFRIKHFPRLGGAYAGMRSLSQISAIQLKSPAGEAIRLGADAPGSSLFLAPGCEGLSFLQGKVEPRAWAISPIEVTAGDAGHSERLLFEPDPKATAGVFIWWSKTAGFTVELLSRETTLRPGETFRYECVVRHLEG